ncbi:alpha-L-rhamnosidase [Microlunatus soli]|uniref:alpha-L-rhamnosidase n=1 Tax=Microlunatus soli TaxID=630515 RepID=A0A1H1XM43_9ACTN|nr:alpha-L-rhamnosidase [Microlunatus soli]SDT10270.1 alpha-L-rhamnosidase [Microlunatus soli]
MTSPYGDDAAAAFPQQAEWIAAPTPTNRADRFRAPILTRAIAVDGDVQQATLTVCGLGLQHVTLDGEPVNDHRLDPPFTDFDHRVLYVSSDVTSRLTAGDHELSIMLGRGFFALPTENVWHWHRAPWTGELRAIAELEVHYTDGRTVIVGTDRDWTATRSRIGYDCYYAGESYDATLAIPDPVPVVGAEAPRGRLQPTDHEPIRVTWQGKPTWQQVGESWVADFGRTIAGWVGLRSAQRAGAEVRISYAEKLTDDGRCAPVNEHVTGDRFQVDSYIGDGTADQQWEPLFSYKGYRYVQLDGLSHPPTDETLIGYAAHNDVTRVGNFSSDVPLFETFVDAMARTIENNLHHIPTDTPMYEKNGWTGDAQVGAVSMMSLFDLRGFLIKWLGDLRDAQRPDGWLPVIVPSAGWGFTDLAPSPEWTTVYPHLLREVYRRYGDRELVVDHWPSVLRYLDWELSKLVDGCAVSALGDYLQPGTNGLGPDDSGVTASSLLIRALRDTAELAGVIGEGDDQQRLLQAAASLAEAMNARYLDRDRGRYEVGPVYSQTSNAVPLALGLVPADQEAAVVANLVADIEDRDDHLHVGCIGANLVLRALTEHGHGELAVRVARQTSYPSWGYWFAEGADTMWEMWETTARSRDHYFHGTVVQWLFEDVAGLRCGDHGWQTMTVRPQPVGGLSHAAYGIDTVRGRAAVDWRRDGDTFDLSVDVPPGCTAAVSVPGRDVTVTAGSATESADATLTVGAGHAEFRSTLP